MSVRFCDPVRAREAAASTLANVERLSDTPNGEPQREIGDAFPGREQLAIAAKLLLWKLADGASKKWGEQWAIEEKEADAIAGPLLDVVELEFGAIADDPYSRLYVALGMYALPRLFTGMFGAPTIAAAPAEPIAPAETSSTAEVTPKAEAT